MDSVRPEDLIKSLDFAFNKTQAFNAGQGAGASGSFFFHSYDGKFIIKSLTD